MEMRNLREAFRRMSRELLEFPKCPKCGSREQCGCYITT